MPRFLLLSIRIPNLPVHLAPRVVQLLEPLAPVPIALHPFQKPCRRHPGGRWKPRRALCVTKLSIEDRVISVMFRVESCVSFKSLKIDDVGKDDALSRNATTMTRKESFKSQQGPGQFPLLDYLWSVKGGITGIRRGMLDCPAIAVEFRKVRPDTRQQSTSSDSNFSICSH